MIVQENWVCTRAIETEKQYLLHLNSTQQICGQDNARELYHGQTVKSVMDAIYTGRLKIFVHQDIITLGDAIGILDEICSTLKHLQEIAKRPKSFIRATEHKEYIYKAKKISSKAVFYLTRDSADWEVKKALSIVPRKVLAEVAEETLDIYENRVFVDLIYLIERKIRECYGALVEEKKKNIIRTMDTTAHYTYAGFFAHDIATAAPEDETKKPNVDDYIKKIHRIEQVIKQIKRTDLFRQVSKVWHKLYSVHKTNNFLLDKHYHYVYNLWVLLSGNRPASDVNYSADVRNITDLDKYYFNYVFLSILATLHATDYAATRPQIQLHTPDVKINVADSGFIELSADITFDMNGKTLVISIGQDANNQKYIKITSTKITRVAQTRRENGHIVHQAEQSKTRELYIYPIYFIDTALFGIRNAPQEYSFSSQDVQELIKFLNASQQDETYTEQDFLAEYTTKLLQSHDTRDDRSHVFYCMPITTRDDNIIAQTPKTLKRLYGLGGMYDADDTDIDNCRFFKRGIIQNTPRNNLPNGEDGISMIFRLINLLSLLDDDLAEYNGFCPVCGNSIDGTKCYKCGCCIDMNSLVKHHGKRLLWIKPDDRKVQQIFQKLQAVQHDVDILPHEYICERISGSVSTASFLAVPDGNGVRIQTICPVCGKTSHD